MNKKKRQIYILLGSLLLLLLVLVLAQPTYTTLSRKSSDFAIDDSSTVTKIFLADKQNNSVLLTRISQGVWKVNNKYIARKDGINVLLKTMTGLMVREPVSKASHNNVMKRLASQGVKVEIYQKVYRINILDKIKLFPHEKCTRTYYVGDNTQDNLGTYMLMEGANKPYIMYLLGFNGYLTFRYSPLVSDWRDHTIVNFRFKDLKSVKVEFPLNSDSSYIVEHKGNGKIEFLRLPQMLPIPALDTIKALDFLSSFSSIRYEASVTEMDKNKKDSIISSTPLHIITLQPELGKPIEIKTFRRKATKGEFDEEGKPIPYDLDRLYALFGDEKDFVIIQYFVFDPITRPLRWFFPAKSVNPAVKPVTFSKGF